MTLEEIQKRFLGDRFATECLGAEIEDAGPGYARCSCRIQPQHKNAVGSVMGGAIFTLADFAFAVAANTDQPITVSLTSQITYLGTAKGERLVAEAVCRKSGRTTCYYEILVKDELGSQVAAVTSNGFIKG